MYSFYFSKTIYKCHETDKGIGNLINGTEELPATKLHMCTQTHNKHDKDGRTVPDVRGHGSVPLSHSGNVVMRLELHTHTSYIHTVVENCFLDAP